MSTISDHALIRYIERCYGFDADAVRAEMQTPVASFIEEFGRGQGCIIGTDGLRKFFADGVMVTVLPKNAKRPKFMEAVEWER